ncbi:DUF4268 domain-containing protein [Blastochloris tepida]|uniref:DUF4268 domain-containing protein n=1 Tax=Blastochloris tepida TaxID=2233851 RepID=A0A348G3D4_9HYPH|nr:DUF4268 domain-containing protein [Blastochloris tepida]BBF94067.1 hypothetical protein BLTE_27520 [Blastochloris tepida]
MSSRQHAPLVLVSNEDGSRTLPPISVQSNKQAGGYDEAWVRDLIFRHPEAIPLQEIDPSYGPLIPVCTELDTRAAGYADALFVNPLGMPTLVECKLWRNPEARREVVGQIIDYARAIRRWTFSDLQREAARARGEQGFDLVEHIRGQGHPDLDEAAFADNVSLNLAKGRVMLLVLGDGIREGVEAIADYIQNTAALQFTFGLVEAQVFDLGEGRRIVQPRVLARTLIVNRTVIDLARPDLAVSEDAEESETDLQAPRELDERQRWMKAFWTELLDGLRLDDAEQPLANVRAAANIFFPLAPRSNIWITCYFLESGSRMGVFLASRKNSPLAQEIVRKLAEEREQIEREIGIPMGWPTSAAGKIEPYSFKEFRPLRDDRFRREQLEWFRKAINSYVNAFRPRVANLVREIADNSGAVQS